MISINFEETLYSFVIYPPPLGIFIACSCIPHFEHTLTLRYYWVKFQCSYLTYASEHYHILEAIKYTNINILLFY